MTIVRRLRTRGNLSLLVALLIVLAVAGAVVLLLYVAPDASSRRDGDRTRRGVPEAAADELGAPPPAPAARPSGGDSRPSFGSPEVRPERRDPPARPGSADVERAFSPERDRAREAEAEADRRRKALAAAAAPPPPPRPTSLRSEVQEERMRRARTDLALLAEAITRYHAATGRNPNDLEELMSPVRGYADGVLGGASLPLDPWRRDYEYHAGAGAASLHSRGADGEPGGEGYEADLYAILDR